MGEERRERLPAVLFSGLIFQQRPEIQFFDQESESKRFPYASTCSVVLYLPKGTSSQLISFLFITCFCHPAAQFNRFLSKGYSSTLQFL